VTDDLVARPADTDLDCHLTGLRLTSVVESPFGDYSAEAVLGFDGSDAHGWWVSAGETERSDIRRVTSFEMGFGIDMQPGYEHLAGYMLARLRSWRDTGTVIEVTCAPGRWTLLSSGSEQVVVPRGEAVRVD
jgi:hypothetical protein